MEFAFRPGFLNSRKTGNLSFFRFVLIFCCMKFHPHPMKSHSILLRVSMPYRCLMSAVSLASLFAAGNALAYKVERVCETTEATNKKPSVSVCKTVLVKPSPAAAKDDKKEPPKAEKPAAAGHH